MDLHTHTCVGNNLGGFATFHIYARDVTINLKLKKDFNFTYSGGSFMSKKLI